MRPKSLTPGPDLFISGYIFSISGIWARISVLVFVGNLILALVIYATVVSQKRKMAKLIKVGHGIFSGQKFEGKLSKDER